MRCGLLSKFLEHLLLVVLSLAVSTSAYYAVAANIKKGRERQMILRG